MLVDVVIPVFGHGHLLPEAVDSLAGQGIPLSVFIVDDGNVPAIEAPAVPANGSVETISLIRQETNKGIAAARNLGLAHCAGDAVIFLDADDQLQPRAISRLMSELRSHECDAVYGFVQEFGFGVTEARATKAEGQPVLLAGSTLLRRSSVDALGGFDETLGVGEFVDFMARAQRCEWNIQPIHVPVLRRRIHDRNTSWSGDLADFLRVVRRHILDGKGSSDV